MLQLICDGLSNRQIAAKLQVSANTIARPPRQHHECARRPQDGGAGRVRAAERAGEPAVNRRDFLALRRRSAPFRRVSLPHCGLPANRVSSSLTSPPPRESPSVTTAVRTAASCCPRRSAPGAPSSTTTPTAGRTSCSSTAWTGPDTSASDRRCVCIATTGTAPSLTSRGRPASTSRCTEWASLSATTTTTAFPIC